VKVDYFSKIAASLSHPNAEAIVSSIGKPLAKTEGTGAVYEHLLVASRHLVKMNPNSSGLAIRDKLAELIEAERVVISENLRRFNRPDGWSKINKYVKRPTSHVRSLCT
jgi:hypothetical protein